MKAKIETKCHIMSELTYEDVKYLHNRLKDPNPDGESLKDAEIRVGIWNEMEHIRYNIENPY